MSGLDYVLADLDAVRAASLIERAISGDRVKVNDDEVTSFTWITLEELEDIDAVLDIDLGSETPTLSGPWWICRCGRKLYEHSNLGRKYVCTFNASGRFQPADRTLDYEPETGLRTKDPM
jgi:hypothetical protein